MLVYTKTKIWLSALLLLSVAANLGLLWFFVWQKPAAERDKYDYLFPGFAVDSDFPVDIGEALRLSFVFVVPTNKDSGYELLLADRRNCSQVYAVDLTKEQLVSPSLYSFQPIIVNDFRVSTGDLTLLKVEEDTFTKQHVDDLRKACPEFMARVFREE